MKRLLILCGIALVLVPAASAGITINQTAVHWGDSVTFTVTSNASLVQIGVSCYTSWGSVLWGTGTAPFAPPLSPTVVMSGTPGSLVDGWCRATFNTVPSKGGGGPKTSNSVTFNIYSSVP